MQEVYRTIARWVGADLNVLITGESGHPARSWSPARCTTWAAGARQLLHHQPRRVPRERVETELFGKEDASRQADRRRRGTLFLDEIGDMPLDAQTRLLRVIDARSRRSIPRPAGGRTCGSSRPPTATCAD